VNIRRIEDFTLGWFVGNFSPTIYKTADFEICLKYFKAGDLELRHFQKTAIEITAIVSGEAIIGEVRVEAGDIIEIEPLEIVGFEAITDVALVAIKFPSIPDDKVLA
jgi:hypothetical protein